MRDPATTSRARDRLYRRFRWGRHLELFLLDTRFYRDANTAPDDGEAPKTMLGAEQRAWLVEGVASSDATWKVVVSSVPISIPTGGAARDGWANYDTDQGFERELLEILSAWRAAGVRNLVFVTTDVHFATGFRYAPFPDLSFLEFVSGPLNAGLFPKLELDDTLRPERLFLYAPPGPGAVDGLDDALRWFNFGEMEIDAAGTLAVRIVNGRGEIVFETSSSPAP
jgi:alkaline phosphatase D